MSFTNHDFLPEDIGPPENRQLIAQWNETNLAQLPEGPTFKTRQPKKAAPYEMAPQAPPKTSESPNSYSIEKTSGLNVEGRTFGANRDHLEKAIATVAKEGGCLHFSSGTWKIDADLTIPAGAAVRLERGALLQAGTQKISGTLATVNEPGLGTLTILDGSTQVTGLGTSFDKLRIGQSIMCAGQRREIRKITDHTHLEVWPPFKATIKDAGFSTSTYKIKGFGTKFKTELEVGDFIYHGKENYIVTSISGPDSLTVAEYPGHPFSDEPFVRSVRVKILGSLEAGLYQIFSGKGVVKFAAGAVTAVHPEWWGAKGNADITWATANSDAIEKAIFSFTGNYKTVVVLSNGKYVINRSIVVLNNTYLLGQGMCNSLVGGTVIHLADHSNCPMIKDSLLVSVGSGGIKNIMFNMSKQDAAFNGLQFLNGYQNIVIQQCGFVNYTSHAGGYAIFLGQAGSFHVTDNFIMGWSNGINAYGFDSWYVNNELATTGDYGIRLVGDGNIVQGNIIYGDGGCRIGIFVKTNFTNILGNRINNCDYGIQIHINGGIISGNIIGANKINGIYSNYVVRDAQITDNLIRSSKSYAINFTNCVNNSVIKNNTIIANNGGSHNPQIKLASFAQPGFEEPLVEDNVGVDLQCDFPILPSNSKPNTRTGKRWKTANSQSISIVDFLGGCKGKEILIFFGDAKTILKFSGSTNLKGHGGVDWQPVPGDHLRAVKGDNGSWYCECFNSTNS